MARADDRTPNAASPLSSRSYAPLRLSQQQQQQLWSWMDTAGVFAEDSARMGEGVRSAPTAWSLEVDVHAVRLRLFTDGAHTDGATAEAGEEILVGAETSPFRRV